ncbi:unnamed protein product, partial [Effrenium voratum]
HSAGIPQASPAMGALFWVFLPLASARLSEPRNASDLPNVSLVQASCTPSLLELMDYAAYDNFNDCVESSLNSSGVALGSALAYTQCWCKWNVSSFIRAQKCEDHKHWKWLMEVDCQADCGSAAAQCASCPLLCFESNSSGLDCTCRDGCRQYLNCLEENQTVSDSCDSRALQQSAAMQEFDSCTAYEPAHGGSWTKLSMSSRCLCAGTLQQELQEQQCCNRTYAAFCSADCSVDCSQVQAQLCVANCTRLCDKPSEACDQTCLREDAPCNRYKVCHVAMPQSYPYVCDDGGQPDAHGCCVGVFDTDRCPLLCDVQWKRAVWQPSGPVSRCECVDCPTTREETFELMNMTLIAAFERAATKQLMFILMTHGLRRMNPSMEELFSLEMDAVRKEIARHNGILDWKLVHSLRLISFYYFQKLSRAAASEVRTLNSMPVSFGMVWLSMISGACLVVITALCFAVYRNSSKLRQPARGPPEQVVGRPISSKEPPEATPGVIPGSASTARGCPAAWQEPCEFSRDPFSREVPYRCSGCTDERS